MHFRAQYLVFNTDERDIQMKGWMIPVFTIVPAHEINHHNKPVYSQLIFTQDQEPHWVPQAADNRHPHVVEQKRICIVDNGVAPRRLGIGFRWTLGQNFFWTWGQNCRSPGVKIAHNFQKND